MGTTASNWIKWCWFWEYLWQGFSKFYKHMKPSSACYWFKNTIKVKNDRLNRNLIIPNWLIILVNNKIFSSTCSYSSSSFWFGIMKYWKPLNQEKFAKTYGRYQVCILLINHVIVIKWIIAQKCLI
jgi:hypothetical protein